MDDDSVHVVCSQCQKEVPRCNLTTHKLRCPGAKRQSPSPPRMEQLSHDEPMEQQQRRHSIVDLTNDSPLPSPPPSSTGPLPPPPTLGPLSPPAAAVAGEHWECPYCSFHNEMVNEVCGMCFKTPGGEGGGDGRVSIGTLGRGPHLHHHHQQRGQGSRGGRAPSSSSSEPARGTWECPLCTFHNERGRFVCEACETGRPRQQDLDAMDEDDEVDGFVVTNPPRGYRRDARGRMQAVGGGSEFQLLQNILDGAMLGAGAGGAASIMTGASPAQARQRMLSAMVLGGIGGGLFGNHVRAAFGGLGDQPDIDRMSYEDMLRVFGPGHVPEKASVETVTSLPVTLMTDAELERLQRPDVQEGRDCLVCMEDFVRGDEMKRLPCTHIFHSKCIDKWLVECANTCPVCKWRVSGEDT